MDTATKELIDKILKTFEKKGYQVHKIYWNTSSGEVLVVAPLDNMDGLFVYVDNSNPIPFVPHENFKLYDRVAQDKNIIYDKNEVDLMIH